MRVQNLMVFLLLLIMSGCGEITIGPRTERKVYWEKLGTSAEVIDDTQIEVLVRENDGKKVPAKVNPSGMMLLDSPTYELYFDAWKRQKAAREMVPVDVTPRELMK